MAHAIITQYKAPTSTCASRMFAKCGNRKMHLAFNHELSATANHKAAARTLAAEMEEAGLLRPGYKLHTGTIGDDFVHVIEGC